MFDTDLDESIKWLKEREGFRPRPYSDYKQTSIGYGTGNTGLKHITEPQAADLLKNEIITRRSALGKDYPQGISNWAKLALDDRLYNAGVESVRKSKFLNALKGLDEDEAERQLYDWNKVNVGGKLVENEGLTNRVRDLGARRGPASETPRKYDTSKSPFTQSDIYANIKNDPAFNETKNRLSYLQQLEAAKKYKDDGFRMAGVEGGAQPVTSLDLNTLFSNDNPLFNVLPKVQTETIEKNIEPVSEQLPSMDEVNEPTQNSEGQPQQIEFGDNLAEGQPLDNNTMKMLNQLSSIDPNTVETVQPKTSEVDKYSNLLNMYNSLQKSRNLASETEDKKGLLQGIASAGSTIGAAIAGIKPDREGLKAAFSGDVNTLQQVDKRSEELQKYQKMIEEMKAGEFDQDYKNRYLQYLKDQLAQQEELKKLEIGDKRELKDEKTVAKEAENLATKLDYSDKTRALGSLTQSLTQAKDRINTMFGGLKFERDEFGNPKYNEAELIKVLNSATPTQKEELVKQLDTLLTGKAPTVASLHHLRGTVESYYGNARAFFQKLLNQPITMQEGKLLSQMFKTVQREGDLADEQLKDMRIENQGIALNLKNKDPQTFKKLYSLRNIDDVDMELRDLGARAGDILNAKAAGLTKEQLLEKMKNKDKVIPNTQPVISPVNKTVKIEGKVYSMTPEAIAAAKKDGHVVEEME